MSHNDETKSQIREETGIGPRLDTRGFLGDQTELRWWRAAGKEKSVEGSSDRINLSRRILDAWAVG